MVSIRQECPADAPARESLLDLAFGDSRFAKASERLREGNVPARGLAFVAADGDRVIGTVRLWPVLAGRSHPALLLGPLAVATDRRNDGVGGGFMRHALREAGARGHGAVLLVGDAPYYGRFGFTAAVTRDLRMPGPYEPERLLGVELVPGALSGAKGMLEPDPSVQANRALLRGAPTRLPAAGGDLRVAA